MQHKFLPWLRYNPPIFEPHKDRSIVLFYATKAANYAIEQLKSNKAQQQRVFAKLEQQEMQSQKLVQKLLWLA